MNSYGDSSLLNFLQIFFYYAHSSPFFPYASWDFMIFHIWNCNLVSRKFHFHCVRAIGWPNFVELAAHIQFMHCEMNRLLGSTAQLCAKYAAMLSMHFTLWSSRLFYLLYCWNLQEILQKMSSINEVTFDPPHISNKIKLADFCLSSFSEMSVCS